MEKGQKILVDRIEEVCKMKGMTRYQLAYKSTVPLTTLTHIMKGSTKNPGIITIFKICDGLGMSLMEFFDTEDFAELIKE